MIEILMKRNFFHVKVEDLAIDVAYFVLDQYDSWSGNCRFRSARSLDIRNGRCGRRWWIGCGEMLYQASVILVHDSHLLGYTMYLTMKTLKTWLLLAIR